MINTEGAGLSRRTLFGAAATAAAATMTTGATASAAPRHAGDPRVTELTADQAWRKLVAGNDRFVAGHQKHPHESLAWRESLVNGQHPFAVILSCADSRVPPELVFDEGLGDLFVIRAAGEVLDTAVIGSIEYAVEHLGVPLIVVLGHASCGAVSATIDVVNGDAEVSGDISTLVRSVEPAVRATAPNSDPAAFLAACVAEQARRSAGILRERSNIVSDAVAHHGVKVFSATYELATGKVTKL
ncbi:carbonic anhydrase [Actinophytocola sp.]|uniref:carbonic anhydrase n=1 Tax=Actinophytocola sp. TaxID=1872138 RepID=UPI002EDA4E5C